MTIASRIAGKASEQAAAVLSFCGSGLDVSLHLYADFQHSPELIALRTAIAERETGRGTGHAHGRQIHSSERVAIGPAGGNRIGIDTTAWTVAYEICVCARVSDGACVVQCLVANRCGEMAAERPIRKQCATKRTFRSCV